MAKTILSIRDLCVDYVTDDGPVRAVDHVSLDIFAGETIGIAGESGSGKTTLAQAILRILQAPAVISHGQILFEGRDLLDLDETELRAVRWSRISMVFQSAMDSLNPVITIGEQIVDAIQAHGETSAEAARSRAGDLLEMVGIPRTRLQGYAHQLSGGMRQRVGIALALALEPALIILDEPTTALDVIVEREILEQIRGLQTEMGFAVMFITHDLARMLQVSDRVAIFYAARLAEVGAADLLREAPMHPYTQGLLRAFPPLMASGVKAQSIPGSPPSLTSPPSGCRFHPRCPRAESICREVAPEPTTHRDGHIVSCHLPD